MEFELKSLKDTEKVAKSLANVLSYKEILLLSGELGSGKTTFVKYIAKHLGFDEKCVTSPSFTIIEQYLSKDGKVFYHIDLYRIEKEEEVLSLGLSDIIREECYIAIEWYEVAEKIVKNSSKKIVEIKFSFKNGKRKVVIENLTKFKI